LVPIYLENRKKKRLEFSFENELELFILNVLVRFCFGIFFGLKSILVKLYLDIKKSLELFEMSLR
jgi:hypothetical protein